MNLNCCEAWWLRSRLIQVAYVTSLGCLSPKPTSFEVFGCKYVCKYVCVYVCVYVCMMHVYHRICLDFKYGPRIRGSFVRSQSIQRENKRTFRTQTKCDVENLKPGRNPVWCRKPRFGKRRVWMQVKVKKSRESKRYVSQNISSNSWNSTGKWSRCLG